MVDRVQFSVGLLLCSIKVMRQIVNLFYLGSTPGTRAMSLCARTGDLDKADRLVTNSIQFHRTLVAQRIPDYGEGIPP